jgi:hypothetical protein
VRVSVAFAIGLGRYLSGFAEFIVLKLKGAPRAMSGLGQKLTRAKWPAMSGFPSAADIGCLARVCRGTWGQDLNLRQTGYQSERAETPVKLRATALRLQPNFLNPINAIPAVHSPLAKIFRFVLTPNHPYNSRHPVPLRGASAVVTTRGRLRWTRQRRARVVVAGRACP